MAKVALLAAMLLAGCADDPHYLIVTIDAPAGVHDIAALRVTLANAGSMRTDDFDFTGKALPVTFAVSSPDRTGDLGIAVDALDAAMIVVGTGTAQATFADDTAQVALATTDFVVNTSFAGDESLSDDYNANGFALSATPDGTWLAAFHETCDTPCQMLARRFDATGRAVMSTAAASDQAFTLSEEPTDDAQPATAANGAATIAVWHYADATTSFVSCRPVDAAGATPVDETFLVDATVDVAAVAPIAGGKFVAMWNTFDTPQKLSALVVGPDCTPATGTALTLATATTGEAFSVPALATATSGRTLFVWLDGDDIKGFAGSPPMFAGTPRVLVAATATDHPVYARVVPVGDGFGVIARWIPKTGTAEGRIDMTMFDASGNPKTGAPILVSAATGGDFATVDSFGAAARADGTVLVVWHGCDADGDGNGCGVKGHFATASGAVGADFVIPTTTTGDQKGPSAVALPDNAWAVAWNDASATPPDISGGAVRARIIYGP